MWSRHILHIKEVDTYVYYSGWNVSISIMGYLSLRYKDKFVGNVKRKVVIRPWNTTLYPTFSKVGKICVMNL